MNDSNNTQEIWHIDYSQLMDLRIDFAFKLLFTKGDPRLLISLLNAIFANKKIARVIKSLTIKNPYQDKDSSNDKLSILDIRAELDDGTSILIEMHMYGLGELKAKTIRSWARAFGEELEAGQKYTSQPPTITIAFTDGTIEPIGKDKNSESNTDKIHRLCMIMDCEDFTVFTDAMELHYIDMKAFAKAVNKKGSIHIDDTIEVMFAKWLSVITQKEINDKTIIADICKDEEDINMALSTLAIQSEDKYTRQAYHRRQDEIYFNNMRTARLEQAEREIEQERHRTEQERSRAEQEKHRAEQAEQKIKEATSEIEKLRQQIATLQSNSKS